MFLGRDPAERTTNSTWSVDELWVLPSGTTNMSKETYMCEKKEAPSVQKETCIRDMYV